jgi:PIN domain nuclease of toxin-antitoxin system
MELRARKVRLLVDTHALLWWGLDEPKLSRRARALLEDPDSELHVSAASAWEIATKYRLGRLPDAVGRLAVDMPGWFARIGVNELPISVAHAQRAGALEGMHGDPFDRMIAAQSLVEEIPVLGRDKALLEFGVELIW